MESELHEKVLAWETSQPAWIKAAKERMRDLERRYIEEILRSRDAILDDFTAQPGTVYQERHGEVRRWASVAIDDIEKATMSAIRAIELGGNWSHRT